MADAVKMKGKSACAGIVVAPALVITSQIPTIEFSLISNVDGEIKRFHEAIAKSKKELSHVRDKVKTSLGSEKAGIFEAHMMMLEDPELIEGVENIIRNERLNAAAALERVAKEFVSVFENLENPYMRERAADVRDVSKRVLNHLLGVAAPDVSQLTEDVVIVAHDLAPSDTATLDRQHVLGFLTDIGGKTSHTAIMARSLEIPAVVGLKNISSELRSGDWVAFNGETGEVVVRPDSKTRARYEKLRDQFFREQKELDTLKGKESKTPDGHRVRLVGNIGTPKEVEPLKNHDAEGVGLFRTEFLFMDREIMPTEEEQFEAYQTVVQAMGPHRETIIRTLDIGGDKSVPYIKIKPEMNPFLGQRAIRYCLAHPEVFKPQLRALLRASIYGNLGIMFPMISSVEEVLACRKVLDECRKELMDEGYKTSAKVQVGIMIEIPSAAIMAGELAKHVNFMSIGTNDLVQYTCAVDRMNETLSQLYDPYHPAVLRLIANVIREGHAHGCWVGMCGEMAGQPDLVPLLLGMGLDEFSMAPSSVLRARKIIRSLKLSDAKKIAEHVLTLGTSTDVRAYLHSDEEADMAGAR